MAYSQDFADRIRKILTPQATFIEKEMFGGVAFMVDDKMCVGIARDKQTGVDRLMARIGPRFHHEALKLKGCREMDFAGRPMVGFVFVQPEGVETDTDLAFWISKSLEFNREIPVVPPKKRALLVPKEKKLSVKPLPQKPAAKPVKTKATPVKAAKPTTKPAAAKKTPAKPKKAKATAKKRK